MSIVKSSSKEFLLQKDVNYIQEFNPNSSTTGTPRYYARFDNSNFIIGPTPDASYVTEVHYYYRPTSLTAGSDSGTTSKFSFIWSPNRGIYLYERRTGCNGYV